MFASSKFVAVPCGLPRLNALPTAAGFSAAAQHAVDEVVDEAPRADLRAVVVERDRQVAAAPAGHAANRAVADLARTVDVERPDDRQRQPVFPVVRVRQVLRRELARGVDPAALADRADGRQVVFLALVDERSVDLAGRELDEALDADLERRLDHLMGAEHVHFHRPHRVAIDGIDAGDRRAVDHDLAAVDRLARRLVVHDVALDEVQVLMAFEVRELQRVAVQVVVDHDFVGLDEPLRRDGSR